MGRRRPHEVAPDLNRDEPESGTDTRASEIKSDESEASTGLSFERRDCLTTIGAIVAGTAVATAPVSATEQGYGGGGFGEGAYGDPSAGDDEVEQSLSVATSSVVDADGYWATLEGELNELIGYDSATVGFRWGKQGSGLPNATGDQTLDTTGAFDAHLTDLESNTEYEFFAYGKADDKSDTGATVSFTTDPDADPVIPVLTAEDTSNHRNPHVDASIDWTATIEEGELEAAELSLYDSEGEVLSWRYDLSGQTAEGSENERIKHGNGETFTAELSVYSAHGTTQSRSDDF